MHGKIQNYFQLKINLRLIVRQETNGILDAVNDKYTEILEASLLCERPDKDWGNDMRIELQG